MIELIDVHRHDPTVLAHACSNAFAGHVRAQFAEANENAITCKPRHALGHVFIGRAARGEGDLPAP